MTHTHRDAQRILSIDLCNRGVGFVVLEGGKKLVDWGVKRVRAEKKAERPELIHVKALIRLYRPHTFVTEDMDAPGCRRRGRSVSVTRAVAKLASEHGIAAVHVSAADMRGFFSRDGADTKAQIAANIALRFPMLIRCLPPLRKPWMSEDYRFSIFDAAAFLLTHLRHDEPTF